MDYPKLISEKWNLTAKFNCLQAIYFYAPSAIAVPMTMCAILSLLVLDLHEIHNGVGVGPGWVGPTRKLEPACKPMVRYLK